MARREQGRGRGQLDEERFGWGADRYGGGGERIGSSAEHFGGSGQDRGGGYRGGGYAGGYTERYGGGERGYATDRGSGGTGRAGGGERGWSPYGGGEAPGFGADYGRGYSAPPRRGKPPRGYLRSDERIREDAYDRLMEQDWIDAEDVELAVKDGEVTLTGSVETREDKRALEDLVASVLGVKDVHNQLRIGRSQAASASAPAGNRARS